MGLLIIFTVSLLRLNSFSDPGFEGCEGLGYSEMDLGIEGSNARELYSTGIRDQSWIA